MLSEMLTDTSLYSINVSHFNVAPFPDFLQKQCIFLCSFYILFYLHNNGYSWQLLFLKSTFVKSAILHAIDRSFSKEDIPL